MTISDIIQLIGVLVSLGVGIISIIIAITTLRKNSEMIKESTRPYIEISFEIVTIGTPKGFFVVKNYGSTGAMITDFIYENEIKSVKQLMNELPDQFDLVKGTFLAPGQSKLIPFFPRGDYKKAYDFEIHYESEKGRYIESSTINIENIIKNVVLRESTNGKELRAIANSLEEIAERQL